LLNMKIKQKSELMFGRLITTAYPAWRTRKPLRIEAKARPMTSHALDFFHESLARLSALNVLTNRIKLGLAIAMLREQKTGPALREAMRAWQSQPVLTRLHRAMELTRRKTLPQGLLGQAIDYALKRWEALTKFVAEGTLEIDNNLIENAIRPSALGKRNFLFFGHPNAGERSAVIYTLLGSCRRHGINPFDYLKDLFARLPAAKITQIKTFMPATWAKAKTGVVFTV